MPHALVIEDDPHSCAALAEVIGIEGFSTDTAGTLQDARARLAAQVPDLVLVDLVLPDGNGIEILREAGGTATDVVVVTGNASVDTAVEALRSGAADYLTKPVDIARLRTILTNIKRTRALKDEIDRLRDTLRGFGRFGAMVGASDAMGRVYDLIARVAPTDATVLITGESGTGKELVAQTVHQLSRRRTAPFLPINCSAVSPNLIESELFGHERGSFTGADRLHKGYFERAHGGTLFLDEITEMPMELQSKLLRVLETGTLTRIGGERQIDVDVRLVAATNRIPEDAVRDGKLRDDLLYRLKVFPLTLPPLRERPGDIELLAKHFLQELNTAQGTDKQLSGEALTRLDKFPWPGNVRELRNVLHRAFILADTAIDVACLPEEVAIGVASLSAPAAPSGPSVQVPVGTSAAEAERQLILKTLAHFDGDKHKAAEVLGVSVKTIYNRLNAYKTEE